MSTIERLTTTLNSKYDFKYNDVTSKFYFKEKNQSEYLLIDNMNLNSLYVESKIQVKGISLNDFMATLKSDVCTRYNPFEEYFNNLPKWDGETDYIKQLSSTVKLKRTRYWETYFKKWLVGVVGCLLDKKTDNHLVLIFVGKQGVGKTTWLNKLLPKQLEEHLYMGAIYDNKDSKIHLSECMFINIDEFETIGRKGLNKLKSIITQSVIRIRRPYNRISETLMRRASFMASVNDFKFLVDQTGNRRFLVFETDTINFKHNINMDMVYSQCYHLYKNGFEHYLNSKDSEKINKTNEKYIIHSYEEELLLTYFKPTPKGKGEVLNTTQILQWINDKSKTFMNNTSIIILGKALSKNNFEKGRTKTKGHGWWVKEISNKSKRKSDYTI